MATVSQVSQMLAQTNGDVALRVEYITVENASGETDSHTHIYRVKNTGQEVGMATEQGVEDYIEKKGADISRAEFFCVRQ